MCTQNWIWAQLKGIKFSSLLHLFDFDNICFLHILQVFVFSKLGEILKDKVMNGEEINGEVTDNDDEEETQPCSE